MSSSVPVNSELSNNSFEIVHGKEIWVVSARCNKSSSSSGIWKLVVSLEHQRWSEKWLLRVFDCTFNLCLNISKMLLSSFFELLCIDVSCTCNHYIFANIVFAMELFNLISSNVVDIVSDTC